MKFELWLFSVGDQTLFMIHPEQVPMTDFIDALPFVEPYGYWDDTDPADDVSAEEWTQRAKDWEVAIPSGQTPSSLPHALDVRQPLPDAAEAKGHSKGHAFAL